ncbi:MAG: LuxR C-terminal-related transcriptional regulator [Acidobacteria bacterium]|nr:LuxR C-terminal-related transcriptional regulator [Acidobacteriota bacterium]
MMQERITWPSPPARAEARTRSFFMLLDGTADAAFAVNTTGRISAWNTAAAELFGRSEAEAMSVRCHELFQCSDENTIICSEHCIIERAAQDNRPLANFDLRVQTKTGRLWCNLSTLIATDPASGARHAIHIVRPIELRKRLEQAMSEFVRTQSQNAQNGKGIIPLAAKRSNVPLTSREIDVLNRLSKGYSTRAIANELNISSATVKNHIKHILTKLDAHTRLEAIRHAESAGVI